MKKKNYSLLKEPDWIYEAASCILLYKGEDPEDMIKKHRKWGRTEQEMREYLKRYCDYRNSILPEIRPLLEEQTDLKPYIDMISKEWKEKKNPCYPNIFHDIAYYFQDDEKKGEFSPITEKELEKKWISIISDLIHSLYRQVSENDNKIIKIENLSDIIQEMAGLDISDTYKMLIINAYSNRERIYQAVTQLLERIAVILRKNYFIIEEEYKAVQKEYEKEGMVEEVLQELELFQEEAKEKEILISLRIMEYHSLSIYETEYKKTMVGIGIYFKELYEKNENGNLLDEGMMVSILKALGDQTRFQIVTMLSEKKMYLQEIAKTLKLTPATISHHLDILQTNDLIKVTISDKQNYRIYYTINHMRMEQLAKVIEEIGKGGMKNEK